MTDTEHLVLINFVVDRTKELAIPAPNRRQAIEDLIRKRLDQTGSGYCDGGGGGIDGRADIFCYGPNGEVLWADIEPLIRILLSDADAKITIREGSADDARTTEFHIV